MIAAGLTLHSCLSLSGKHEKKCFRCGSLNGVQEAVFRSSGDGEILRFALCRDCLKVVRSAIISAAGPVILH
jgi:late competence protein required for DNA uptake (superfamily II DNA/RNA helicase)